MGSSRRAASCVRSDCTAVVSSVALAEKSCHGIFSVLFSRRRVCYFGKYLDFLSRSLTVSIVPFPRWTDGVVDSVTSFFHLSMESAGTCW